jgi:hypothetical protein
MVQSHRSAARGMLAVAALLVAGPLAAPLAAQRLSLSPQIGVYIPTADLYDAVTSGADPLKQEAGLTLGGKLGLWMGNRFGIEATGDYLSGKLKYSPSGTANRDADLFTGSAKATFFVIPNDKPVYFAVSGGVGHIRRLGAYYDQELNPATNAAYTDEELRDWTGTAGATVGFRLGRLLHLSVSGETYVYKPNLVEESDPDAEANTQKDVQLKFGVGIPLLGLGS